jgi:hypothetical protein
MSSPRLKLPSAIPFGLLLLFGLSLVGAARAQSANVSVNAAQSVRLVDDRVFGLNTACWDWYFANWLAAGVATSNLLSAIDTRVLRFPGGSTADTYSWSTNSTVDNAGTYTAQGTDFDQFAGVAKSIGAQAFITVNYGTSNSTDAANWVAYSNVTKAYGFKYWEIGNECYGTWEMDNHAIPWDPYTYANQAKAYIAAMKAVDPTIKVGVVAVTGEDSYANNTNHPATNPVTGVIHNGWTPVLLTTLRSLGVTPDFLIYHRYEQNPGQESDTGLLQMAKTWPDDAADLRQQLTDYLGAAGAKVELVVTENNSVSYNPGKQTTSIVNGLYLADSTGNLLQTEFNSLVWWDTRNGQDTGNNNSSLLYGWREYGDYGVVSTNSELSNDLYPTYYVMKLLSHFARGGDTVVSATSDNTLLAAFAAKRGDGSLSLLVINKSPTSSITANISLAGFTPQATATTYTYGIPQDDAAETGIGSPDLATSSLTNANSAFAVPFAPYSATVLSLLPAVAIPPSITTQPSGQTTTTGQKAVFSVMAGGSPAPTYQWQRQASGSSTWTNLSDNATYSGTETATLTVTAVTATMNGDSFQCIVTNASGSVTTTPAALVVSTPLIVSTLAGQAGISGTADGTGSAAGFHDPADVAVDSAGNVYVADTDNQTVRRVTTAGVVSTLAGQAGTPGSADGSGSAAGFRYPSGLTVDSAGNVYVADTDNETIRRVTLTGSVTTLAGKVGISGSTDGSGSAASFNGPSGVVADAAGNLYVADTLNDTIRKVTSAGMVSTIAGAAGASGATDSLGTAARFFGPQGLAIDGTGDLYVADTNNGTIRKVVTATGAVTTVAGLAGIAGSADGATSQGRFHYPSGVAVDSSGNLYVADTDNDALREVSPSGAVTTIAGNAGTSGSADGLGSAARFNFPTGIAVDNAGNIYVADTSNHTIRLGVFPATPTISIQPQNQTVAAGSTAQLSVTASGKPAPTYQWYFNGAAISGATSSILSLTDVQSSNAGDYTVTVTNSSGSVTSNQATLTVTVPAPSQSSSGGGGGGGGGGAMAGWFVAALGLMAAVRFRHGLWVCRHC